MSAEYQTWTFPRETIDEIAREFRDYFDRRKREQLSPREASMMWINRMAGKCGVYRVDSDTIEPVAVWEVYV